MKTIHKYPLNDARVTDVDTYQGVRWLTAQMQPDPEVNGVMTVWGEVDSSMPPCVVRVHVVDTGNEVPKKAARYIGTVQRGSLPWVFHIYAEEEPR